MGTEQADVITVQPEEAETEDLDEVGESTAVESGVDVAADTIIDTPVAPTVDTVVVADHGRPVAYKYRHPDTSGLLLTVEAKEGNRLEIVLEEEPKHSGFYEENPTDPG